MRARNIKPGFFKNESLPEVDPLARLLFLGLWCYADRDGLFEWRPKRIKIEVLPYDNCDIEKLLMSLHDRGFIYKYKVGGKEYGSVVNFKEHQNPHPHEAKSKIPKPELNQCHDMSVTLQEESVASNADSLIEDSLIEDSNKSDNKHFVQKDLDCLDKKTVVDLFETLWEHFPNKIGKKAAKKHFNATVKNSQDKDDITKAMSNYLDHLDDNAWKRPMNGSTWFNNWQDWVNWVEPKKPAAARKSDPTMAMLKKLHGVEDGELVKTDHDGTPLQITGQGTSVSAKR